MNTRHYLTLFGLLCVLDSSVTKTLPPVVQVYSRTSGVFGKANVLLCHVNNFHPPLITVELQKNGVVIQRANQTDLLFGEDWNYHLTKYVPFTPQSGEEYTCLVTHMGTTSRFSWEPDM
ncbi:beta-2-microglobulin-like [Syngnathoides biaculeatus]|uniref:beta-2-microglobulin-like n=1 Tax=Syngnathoides biaculeatus TaxID=300417 RepID=UPI002ADE2F30|nr:beta-2-microglobulin-like [Syngnathoides biaculeatus]